MRRLARIAGRTLVVVVLALVLAEAALRVGALFVQGRDGAWRAGSAHRVLCVGDSHTYGAGVRAEDAYPAQLQRLLDETAPGAYSVLNFGVPGLNTSQVLERLPQQISTLKPDVVVVWAGVNDAWNQETVDDADGDADWRARLDRALFRLRLYKLFRVWQHDRQLGADIAGLAFGDRLPHKIDGFTSPGMFTSRDHDQTVDWGDTVGRIRYRLGDQPSLDSLEAGAASRYEAMAALTRAHGIRMALVTYPLPLPIYDAVNKAVARAGERLGVPVVDSPRAMARVPKDQAQLVYFGHPTGPIYREIARDLAAVIVETRPAGSAPPAAGPP